MQEGSLTQWPWCTLTRIPRARSKHLCGYCAEGDMGGWPFYTRRHSFNKARAESRARGNPELCVLWREGTQFSTHPSALISAAQRGLSHSQPHLSHLPKDQSERQFTRERIISLSHLLQANDKNGLFFFLFFFNLKNSTEKQYATLLSKALVENTSPDSRRRTCGFQIHSVGQTLLHWNRHCVALGIRWHQPELVFSLSSYGHRSHPLH